MRQALLSYFAQIHMGELQVGEETEAKVMLCRGKNVTEQNFYSSEIKDCFMLFSVALLG